MCRNNNYQRRFYAMHRSMVAMNRMIRATQPADKERALCWSNAWADFAKFGSKQCKEIDFCASVEHLMLAK